MRPQAVLSALCLVAAGCAAPVAPVVQAPAVPEAYRNAQMPEAPSPATFPLRAAVPPTPSASPAASAARRVTFTLFFARGSEAFNDDSVRVLREVVAELRSRASFEVLVVGHTDTRGTAQANDALSQRRAERVKALLVAAGVQASRIQALGRGERELLVATGDGVAEPRNRRVEISVR